MSNDVKEAQQVTANTIVPKNNRGDPPCSQKTPEEPGDDGSDSIISDRCWTETYKGDSRRWILRDGISRNSEKLSTMKDTYSTSHQQPVGSPVIGRRARILLDKMKREAEMEAVEELAPKPTVEKYITTYDETFCTSDPSFEPKPPPRSRELYEKYPLYQNQAISYWRFQHVKYIGDPRSIPGMTTMKDINNPFKKSTQFSKPLSDVTDGA